MMWQIELTYSLNVCYVEQLAKNEGVGGLKSLLDDTHGTSSLRVLREHDVPEQLPRFRSRRIRHFTFVCSTLQAM